MKFDLGGYKKLALTLLEHRTPVGFRDRNLISSPRFIMRHDIDFGLEFIGGIPVIEAELGIRATYFIQVVSDWYNPFSTDQAKRIDTLLNMGHKIGMHFDAETVSGNAMLEKLRFEARILEARCGSIEAVSFHIPNADIMENNMKIPFLNTYDKADMQGFDYFSDSCMIWSKGNPLNLLRDNPDASWQVLTHPALWTQTGLGFQKRIVAVIGAKSQAMFDYMGKHSKVPLNFKWDAGCILDA